MSKSGIGVENSLLKLHWDTMVNEVIEKATLKRPKDEYMQTGSKKGLHTEYLGHLLSEMQYLPRAYPNAKW
jgi:ring-1,2-phenylacetyl-CoA epoxidase subunit PaaC